jgi:predicted ester cyclase
VIHGFPDYRWEVRTLLVDGDRIAARLDDTGTHLGPYRGIPPTGRAVRTHELAVYRVADGRIAEVSGSAFHLRLLEQLRAGAG